MLRKHELTRVIKLLNKMWTTDILFEGICHTMDRLSENKKVLDAKDIEYLGKKSERIWSYINLLPEKIENIRDLRESYEGTQGPENIVMRETPEQQV